MYCPLYSSLKGIIQAVMRRSESTDSGHEEYCILVGEGSGQVGSGAEEDG
jgi:hypothetical protein